jgi:hypothetical protein
MIHGPTSDHGMITQEMPELNIIIPYAITESSVTQKDVKIDIK